MNGFVDGEKCWMMYDEMVVCYDEIWMDENEATNLASCLPTTVS